MTFRTKFWWVPSRGESLHSVSIVKAERGSPTIAHNLRAEVYAARAALQESSMARNILNHAALASQQGKRDLAGDY